MIFTLTIDCDGAAFDGDREHEVARILARAANRVLTGDTFFRLLDVNGNSVGDAIFQQD